MKNSITKNEVSKVTTDQALPPEFGRPHFCLTKTDADGTRNNVTFRMSDKCHCEYRPRVEVIWYSNDPASSDPESQSSHTTFELIHNARVIERRYRADGFTAAAGTFSGFLKEALLNREIGNWLESIHAAYAAKTGEGYDAEKWAEIVGRGDALYRQCTTGGRHRLKEITLEQLEIKFLVHDPATAVELIAAEFNNLAAADRLNENSYRDLNYLSYAQHVARGPEEILEADQVTWLIDELIRFGQALVNRHGTLTVARRDNPRERGEKIVTRKLRDVITTLEDWRTGELNKAGSYQKAVLLYGEFCHTLDRAGIDHEPGPRIDHSVIEKFFSRVYRVIGEVRRQRDRALELAELTAAFPGDARLADDMASEPGRKNRRGLEWFV